MSLPSKYFQAPETFAIFLDEPTSCDICGREKKCYDAVFFYGEDSIDAICIDCMNDRKLLDIDSFSCQGDIGELKSQLRTKFPALTPHEINALAVEKTIELEKSTPPLVTWQDWDWPCSDGDYCVFIGYGSRPLYNKLALDGNGKQLFEDSIYYNQAADADPDELWDECMPEREIRSNNQADALGVLFYVFKSLNNKKIVTIWDIE